MIESIEKHNYDGEFDVGYHYKGLVIHAGKGIHEHVCSYVIKKISKNSKILVLGAGTGSFDNRLHDHGYRNVTSSDINSQNYSYINNNIEFVNADLNSNFSDSFNQKFDIIIAIEIIEHLYSTNNFLSNCNKLIKQGGSILISTPNPRSYASRISFFLTGYHSGFIGVPVLYEHVSPLHIGIFRHYCHFNKLAVTHLSSIDHECSQSIMKKILKDAIGGFLKVSDRLLGNDIAREEGKSILFLELKKQ